MKASAAEEPRSEPEERCLPSASMSGMTEPADWVPPHNRGLGDMDMYIIFVGDVKNLPGKKNGDHGPPLDVRRNPTLDVDMYR